MKKAFLFFNVFTFWRYCVVADLYVTLPSGTIHGYERVTPHNKSFRAFQGIPYAKPPLGKLRFQDPVPVENWSGILETIKNGNRCYSVVKDTADENEDCLFLNVFTPVMNSTNSTLLPVMVFLYGGGFRDGGSDYNVYGPDYLLEEDVLMVSLNYRAGPFGFLSTADLVIPGNAGLKDQVLALKWVQQNINLFGGDPNKVTIFGQSAGAASAGWHILSKQAAGLFRGVIAESGSGLSVWAYMANPKPYGFELASKINSSVAVNTSTELLNYLQSVSAKEIDVASTKTKIIDHPLPVIEVEYEGAFLTESMYGLLEKGDFNRVPLFIGANSEEYISLAADMDSLYKRAEGYENNLRELVPSSLNVNDLNEMITIGQEIKTIYIKDGSKMQDNLGLAVAFTSESHFFNPCVRHAEMQSKYTDVYFYKFSYAGVMGSNLNVTLKGAEKCTHGEEMYYYFKRTLSGYNNSDLSTFSENDVLTHTRMVKLWTNFAKYLNPTPEKSELFQNLLWPKVQPNNVTYIDIDTNLEIKSNIKEGRYLRWKEVFDKYAIGPLVTF